MKKKLTQIQKLKVRIKQLEYELREQERATERAESKNEGVEETMDRMKKILSPLEGSSNPIWEENQWLKDTLRLVIIPKGKEEALARLIDKEQKNRLRGY